MIYINGGWDERFAQFKPAMLGILDAIEDAFERGDRRMDFGPGAQPYKLRFADGTDPLAWSVLIAPGRSMPRVLAQTLPRTTWRGAALGRQARAVARAGRAPARAAQTPALTPTIWSFRLRFRPKAPFPPAGCRRGALARRGSG